MSAIENDARTISDALEIMRHGRPLAPRSRSIRTYANGRISTGAREVYSYGSHFPLFRHVPRSGRRGELFVINGDEWRSPQSRTSAHQAEARRLIQATGAPSVVIPFSALTGAGIEIDSIRPVDVREDKAWTETRYADVLEDVPQYLRRIYKGYEDGRSIYEDRAPDAGDGRYSWPEHMHRLGDCLFSAVRAGKRARFLSSFDYQERAPLYFLVQVPRGAGDTVTAAIDSLAPRAVWAARARGRRVERQGDIFFIETGLTEIDLYARGVTGRARLTQYDRDARPRKGEVGYRHETAQVKRARVAAFYRLRRSEYRRIRAEYWADTLARYLGNPERSMNSRQRRTLIRDRLAMSARRLQTFNTPDGAYLTDGNRARAAWSRAHEIALAKYGAPANPVPVDYRTRVRDFLAIYGTAHTAREVLRVKGGAVYVRGKVSHRPGLVEASRDGTSDHAPLELSNDVWYLAVRNRVPRARR